MEDIIAADIKEFTAPDHVALKVKECIEAFEGKELLESANCACGQPSEYGCHGVKNNEVYDEYLCKKCYNKE